MFEKKKEEGSLDMWIQYQAKMKLALIPNMMYLPRVQANTQMKSESLKPKEDTFKEISKEKVMNYAG